MKIQLFKAGCKAILFNYNGKMLIVRKNPNEPHPISGKWHTPGGIIDQGEQPEDCMLREIGEETGYTAKVERLLHLGVIDQSANAPAHFVKGPGLFIFYLCRLTGGRPRPGDDVSELKWVSPKEAIRLMPREIEKDAVRKYLQVMR